MQVTLKKPARVYDLSFSKGVVEVPEWTVTHLRNAGVLLEEKAPKKEEKKSEKKEVKTKSKSKK